VHPTRIKLGTAEIVCKLILYWAFSLPFPVQESLVNLSIYTSVRDDYLQEAHKIITDPNALINVVSRRAKQLKFGNKPLVESLERLEPEDIALREIIEGKITYQPFEEEEEI